MPVLAVVHRDDNRVLVSELLNTLPAAATGSARPGIARTTDNGNSVDALAALQHHGRNSCRFRTIAERVRGVFDVAADIQMSIVINNRRADGET